MTIANQFNTFALKEYSKRDLLRVLDSVRGRKALVIDSSVSGPLSLVAEFNMLKDHGVDKIYHLSDQIIETECKNIIYLTRPNLNHVRWIANQVKNTQESSQTSSTIEYSIFFVPRRSLLCDKFLQEAGILGDVVVDEFHLDLIPFDEDILSLEMNDSFRSLFVDGDTTVIKILSNALMKFQILYGFFPKVIGKGDHANQLAELLERSRVEYLSNYTGQAVDQKDSEFDSMIIIDRSVDFFTPLRSQLTYEGLLDELYTINSCFVELDVSFFPHASVTGNAKSKKIMVNGSDLVFSAIRDRSFEMVPEVLNGIALQIQMEEGSHHSMNTSSELKNFAARIGSLTTQKQALSTHQKIYEKILAMASLPPVTRRWKLEESITLRAIDTALLMDQVDDLLSMAVPYLIPLKLVCLFSLANGGIKQKLYDQFFRDFCNTYGAKHMFTLQNLEKLGILLPATSTSSKSKFGQISKALHLVNDYESSVVQTDSSYAYAGYAPISLRLIQMAAKSLPDAPEFKNVGSGTNRLSWEGCEDVLSLLPGQSFEKSIIPETRMYKSARNSEASPITLVVFVGGCTLAEISALRTISQNEKFKRKYVVVTTGILNDKRLLESLLEI